MTQSDTTIPDRIFFKIGEVCDLLDVQAHVLRYWETEFPMLSPKKNKSGQRTYRRKDVETAFRIKELLYDDQYTIAGAIKRLQSDSKKGTTSSKKIAKPEKDVPKANAMDSSKGSNNELAVLGDEQKEALKRVVTQLLEVREILSKKPTFEVEQEQIETKQV